MPIARLPRPQPAPASGLLAAAGRGALYVLATLVMGALTAGPVFLLIGVAGDSLLGYLAAAGWIGLVMLVAWGFGEAAKGEGPVAAGGRGTAQAPRRASRTRRFLRRHLRLIWRQVDALALVGAGGVAALMLGALVLAMSR